MVNLKSTNAALHVVFIILEGFLVALGVPMTTIVGFIESLTLLVGAVREKGFKPKFTLNLLVYVVAILGLFLPELMKYWEVLPDLVEAIIAKDINRIFSIVLLLINFIVQQVRNKPNLAPRDLVGR
jgi:hypothetical protein